jgi:hypothetical protein
MPCYIAIAIVCQNHFCIHCTESLVGRRASGMCFAAGMVLTSTIYLRNFLATIECMWCSVVAVTAVQHVAAMALPCDARIETTCALDM